MRRLPTAVACVALVVAPRLASSSASARHPPKLLFQHLTADDGLSHNWVQSILKDSRGFLWFGTQDGLNRYDGASLKTYRHDPLDPESLPSSVAHAMLEDSRKRLWICSGWGKAGLALYDRARDRFVRYLPSPEGSSGNEVRAVLEDHQGRLWLGSDAGLVLFDPAARTFQAFTLPSEADLVPRYVTHLLEDRRHRLWVGSDVGLFRFDPQSRRFSRWGGAAPSDLGRRQVSAIQEDADGRLWIARLQGGGLARIDPDAGREVAYLPVPGDETSLSDATLLALASDGKGRLYVGTQHGLNLFDTKTGRSTRFLPDLEDERSLNGGSIWSLRLDEQGMLWIGVFNGGVNVASIRGQRFALLRAGRGRLSDPQVAAVILDHAGRLWIGTDGGGLNRLDRTTGAFTYYRHDPNDPTTIGSDAVLTVCEDRRQRLWLGGWEAGLGQIDPASGRVVRYLHDQANPASIVSSSVFMVGELGSGELLVSTQEGADLFDPQARRFSRLSDRYPGAGQGTQLVGIQDRRGDLWLGGQAGVEHVERASRIVTKYQHDPHDPRSLPSGWVEAILVDSRDNVWIGTEGGLACLPAGAGALRHFTTADGQPLKGVTNIIEDAAGGLWLSANGGLARMADAVRLPESPVFLFFDVDDGLQGSQFARAASFRSPDGEMFFGGSKGLNSFFPERIEANLAPPPVVLTDLRLLNRSVRPGVQGSPLQKSITEADSLTLSYRANAVTFEFAALNFIVPQKNRYSYKLEGFDRDWSPSAAERTATYTNLSPGGYVFRVRASNNDGAWNQAGAALPIRVTPPFWRTWWFRALGLSALAAALAAAHRYRVRQLRRSERELQKRVEEALSRVKVLRGLLPICAHCKKVRNDQGYWSQIEAYIADHSEADFSHCICDECLDRDFPEYAEAVKALKAAKRAQS